jgi:hypothetical protein
MKKIAIAILLTALMMVSIVAPLVSTTQAADSSTWYTSSNGVLGSDYYLLYPYTKASVNVGFSKFGELIGLPAGMDPATATQADYIGLQYDSRDPFAPPTVVPQTSWINGWYMDLQYIDPALSGALRDRHLFAFAMFGDGFGFGGDWVYAATPGSNPGHGRQTNGVCVTDPLKVLYDGPREYIAMAVTHIYDKQGTTTWPVVDLAITLRFNKVSKEVVLYKDVKIMLPKLHLWGKLDVQLSNREEYDLGPAPTYDSYAHFYKDFDTTPYDDSWHLADGILREYIDYFVGDGAQKVFTVTAGSDIASDFIKIWVNGVFQDPSTYTVDWSDGDITFAAPPADDAVIEVHYKYWVDESMGQYDLAQVISSDGAYVAWAAMWPPTSDYTVDGILRYMDPLVQVNENDMDYEPKQSPLVIGEWDFLMDHTDLPQYRCVEVKGITDRHDGQDADHGDGNVVDREAMYQLDMVFNPWDLQSASEKYDQRWVEWKLAGAGTSLTTKNKPVLVVDTDEWDQYCTFADRVIDMNTGLLLNRWLGDYSVKLNADGTATFSGLISSHKYKILYSTEPEWHSSTYNYMARVNETFSDVNPGDTVSFGSYVGAGGVGPDPLGVTHTYNVDIPDMLFTVKETVTGDFQTTTDNPNLDDTKYDFVVTPEESFSQTYFYYDQMFADYTDVNVTLIPTAHMNLDIEAGTWGVYLSYVDVRLHLNAILSYSYEEKELNVSFAPRMSYVYDESMMGRYEWVTVGRDAETVDSAGSALVAEAMDSLKAISIGISGADMADALVYNQMPSVMAKFGSGTSVSDYKDSILRAALSDDWCTYWPVASSDMIGIGGPLANVFAYYANDFEDAFYGMSPFAGSIYNGSITGIPCWNRGWFGTWNVYSSFTSSSIGYAVISTTKDLNGTVLFNVYGHFGRDTYYACQWLHGDEARGMMPGLIELQDAPPGATSIILKINYADPKHPTYTIPEVLGTISETAWYYQGSDVTNPLKGGIHDP